MSAKLPLLSPEACTAAPDAQGPGRLVALHPQPAVPPPPIIAPSKRLSSEVATCIPEHLCQRYCIIPLLFEDNRLHLAMQDILNVIAIDDIRLITGFDVQPVPVDEAIIRRAIDVGDTEPLFDAIEALGLSDLLDGMYAASAAPPPGPRPKTPRERINPAATFPLQAIDVDARLSGPFASVKLSQRFANPYDEAIEALYIFPLSAGAAVHAFRMRVGDRVVESVLQERKQARQTYETGKSQGYRAALIEQDRDNVFTVSVGNLPPGEEVSIELEYAERLECHEAATTFRFPLVVAPRYMPGEPLERPSSGAGVASDTKRVPDASRITPPLLLPELRGGARLKLAVHLEAAGRFPRHLTCSQHATSQQADGDEIVVSLARADELLDRDFILQFRLAAKEAQATLLVNRDTRHFLLSVLPPRNHEPAADTARDVVFLLDRSASMTGAKMQSARQAVLHFLDSLGGHDHFTIMAFDDQLEVFDDGAGPRPLARRAAARDWLAGINARGGTEIREPMRRLLAMRRTRGRLPCAIVITDGQVGNESEIFDMVARSDSPMRLFTLGIDTAVNDAFLRRVAELGRGSCELVTPGEALVGALDRLARDTGRAVVSELAMVDKGLRPQKDSMVPRHLPDLFATRPLWISGRARANGGVELRGELAGGTPWTCRVGATASSNPAIGVLWARERVKALEDLIRLQPDARAALEADIVALALEYGLLTRFTSFVLVDRSEVVNKAARAQTLVQPVEMPAQWSPQGFAPFGGFGAHDYACLEDTVKCLSDADFGLAWEEDEAEELSLDKLKELVDEAPIKRCANLIISQAINDKADAIVIAPMPHNIAVFYRVGDTLTEVMSPPLHIYASLVACYKKQSGLDVASHGGLLVSRMDVEIDDLLTYEIDLVFDWIPEGQRIMMHLHDPRVPPPALDTLGLSENATDRLRQLLQKQSGLLLVVARPEGRMPHVLRGLRPALGEPSPPIVADGDSMRDLIEVARHRLVLAGCYADDAKSAVEQFKQLSGHLVGVLSQRPGALDFGLWVPSDQHQPAGMPP